MRVAIIGCGHIAQVHSRALKKIPDVQIAAFADIKAERAERMSQEFTGGKADVFNDYILMLEKVQPEVVHICTPHYLHVSMAIEAIKRGIAVFMEKPPAVTEEEFEGMKGLAADLKVPAGFCFQNRYNKITLELDKLAQSGELGKVTGVRGIVTWKRDKDYYSDDWHGSLEKECGGALINQSIHTLDLMLRYLGKPVKVSASMQNHHLGDVIEVEDTLEAWMEFEEGKRASFFATTAYACDAPVILELSFERGRATMIDRTVQICEDGKKPVIITCEENGEGIGKSYWGSGHLACISDFYDCLINKKAYGNDIDGVENTLRTTMKIYKDARRRNEKKED